jgi:NAD(P)-dependent dehydrogenase (short-subunit alcohol dehydrogenase family)
MRQLEGKVALVTGASVGIGRAIAVAYGREGAKVVVNYSRSREEAEKTAEMVKQVRGEPLVIQADVAQDRQVRDMVAQTLERFGRIDVLVNNAGITAFVDFADLEGLTDEMWDRLYNVNVKGTFFGAQEAVKQFLKQGTGGNIINIVSTAGLGGHPRQAVYNTSKGAAANLTRCLAIEYGKDKIRVNGICPTYCKTALTRAFYDDKDFDKLFVESIPLHRWGETKDVADLAVFLASDESSYIHGDLIKLDGGEQLCRYSV